MTAIAGLWRYARPVEPESLANHCRGMLRAQSIYGPDDMADHLHGQVAVGRCLMRTLPEDIYDQGPVVANGCLMVADVRLDNREELISALALPRDWTTRAADSAILFAALQRWADRAPARLVGDYAFAFWDYNERHLLLGRDPLGERPLHFHRSPDLFAFASMPKGLHALPEVPYSPDLNRLAHRIAQVRPAGSASFYENIERLEPGCMAVVTTTGVSVRRHWVPQRHKLRLKTTREYAEALCEVLDRAVSSRLRGATDVGSQLSGGLDSTSVTAAAARLQARRGRRGVAYTSAPRIGYDSRCAMNRFGDESQHAAAVAALYDNMEHVIVRPDGRTPLADLDANIRLYDKPLLNPCNAMWMAQIYADARARGIRVVLSGQLGNATISYNGRALLAEAFSAGRLRQWLRESMAITRSGWATWPGVLRETIGPHLPRGMLARADRRRPRSSAAAFLRTLTPKSGLEAFERLRQVRDDLPVDSWSHRMEWLRRNDRGNENIGALGGWGVECRDPTADRRVVEFCLSVPTELFLRGGLPSYLLREAMTDRLPPLVLQERRKGLQFVDWHESMTTARGSIAALIEQLAVCEPVAQRLDIPRLRAAVENWPQGGWDRPEILHFYRTVLLRSLSAGHFAQRVLNQRR
jgi:asparagine synthase (glutamine-hydrolysing)